MPFASTGRRQWLQSVVMIAGLLAGWKGAGAQTAAVQPVRELCNALLEIMRAGHASPFAQRFSMVAPVIDRAFDLAAILQVSVGLSWSTLPANQRDALLTAFRRYTIANYVSNFNDYDGQHFDIQPQPRSLPNGETLVQSRIIASSGSSHELDYVMRSVGGAWKVVDVLADGSISRVAVQRSDFRRLLSGGGASALIQSLNQKTSDLSGGALT